MHPTIEIRAFINDTLLLQPAEPFNDDQSFLDSDFIQFTDMLKLVAFLETRYGIEIEPQEMLPENLDSIDRAAAFVAKKVLERELDVLAASAGIPSRKTNSPRKAKKPCFAFE